MPIKLYNTLTRKKEALKLNGTVRIYTCGPTVYDYAHIGNFRAYLFYDLLRRWLEFRRLDVKHVMNITDIDDKTIKGSRTMGASLKDFTRMYEKAFFEDLERLRILKANVYPRATEHIQDMVEMITKLLLRGFAYKSEDGSVYFNIKKFHAYGKLSRLKIKELKAGARVSQDEYAKEEARDFALWKAWVEEDGDVFWNTKLGKGRPGWHIECSVMAMKYLKTIDIHGGGVDLIFPHHENEIAQSEASTGKKFAKYWVHCEHLMVDGRKMSKSLGNFFTLRDINEKGGDLVAFRYLAMSAHYRSQLNFTFPALEDARKTVDNINDFMRRISWAQTKTQAKPNHKLHTAIRKARERFEKAMDNDLNTPAALAEVFGLMKTANKAIENSTADRKSLQAIEKFMRQANQVFDILEPKENDGTLTKEEAELIQKREEARNQKNFAEADRIRAALKERGIELEDTPGGTRWKKQ